MSPDTILILQTMKTHFASIEALTSRLDKIEEALSRIEAFNDDNELDLDYIDDELDIDYVDTESESDVSVQSAPF